MFKTDLPSGRFEMAVLGCRSLVLVILMIIRKRWRNPGFSQRSENYENVCVMLQKS